MSPKMQVEVSVLDKLSSEVVKINNNLSNFTNNIERTFSGLTKGFIAATGAFGATYKIIDLYLQARKEFKESIDSQNQLRTALGYTSKALIDQAEALSKKLLIDDADIYKAQQRLANYVKDENAVKRLTPAVLDLAKAKGIDLASAADIVAKSISSDSEEINGLKIKIDGAAGSAERIDSVILGLNEKFKGQAQAARDSADAIDKAAFSWKNLLESVGDFLTEDTTEQIYLKNKALLERFEENLKKSKWKQKYFDPDVLKAAQEQVSKYETEINKKKDELLKKQKLEAEEKTLALTAKLREEYLKTTEDGRIILLREEMDKELKSVEYNEEQKLLIRKRYLNLIAAAEKKNNKSNMGHIKDEDLPDYMNPEFIKAEWENTAKAQNDATQQMLDNIGALIDADNERALQQSGIFEQKRRWTAEEKMMFGQQVSYQLGLLSSLIEGQSKYKGLYKAITISKIGMETFFSAQKAYSSALEGFPPPANLFAAPVFAGIAVAAGLKNMSEIAKFAAGTLSAPGGMAMVGEHGPEMMYVPQGSRVYNNQETRNIANNSVTVHLHDNSGGIIETFHRELRRGGSSDRLISYLNQRLAVA